MTLRAPDRTSAGDSPDLSLSVHGGNVLDSTMALRTPLVMANSYQLPDDPSEISWSATAPGLYTRNTGVNQAALRGQARRARRRRGRRRARHRRRGPARRLLHPRASRRPRGRRATSPMRRPGDCGPNSSPQRYGIEATFVDMTDLDAVRAAMRPETKLVCVEAIANPTTKVADIAALADIAHAAGALAHGRLDLHAAAASTARSTMVPISSCTPSRSTSTGTAMRWAAR